MKTEFRSAFFLVMTVMLIIGAGAGYALAAEQSVALSPSSAEQAVGSSFTLSASYDVSDGDNTLTGLGVRFHFDSTKLQFSGYSDLLQTDLIASQDQPQDDSQNFDNDPSTDKYVSIAWASFTGNWPNETLQCELGQLGLTVHSDAPAGSTRVNVSFSSIAAGYTVSSTDAAITITVPLPTAAKIRLEADPARISSMTPSESTLTATILDANDNVVDSGSDSTLAVTFAMIDTTYGDIKAGETNPVNAVNGVATIVIVSKVHVTGGEISCTADATGAQGQGALVQGTVAVTTGPFSIVPAGPVILLVNESHDFNVTGGVAPYTWSVTDGTLSKSTTQTEDEKVVFTAPGSKTTGITIKVSDSTGVESEAIINVYEPVEIPDKPAEPPIVEAGDSSSTFTVTGGDGTYTWTVEGPVPVDEKTGSSYEFTAPSDGAFAGVYTITVTDGNAFNDSFEIKVPMKFTPQSKNIKGGGEFDLVLAGADFDAAVISNVEFLNEDLNVIPEEEMVEYATFTQQVPIDFDENCEATATVKGTNVIEVKVFKLRATVAGDSDLTESNGLNVAATGWVRVLPVVTYSGVVQETHTGTAIADAAVIFKLGGVIQGEPISTEADGIFSTEDLELLSPAIKGAEYEVVILADGYVARTDITTAGWVNPKTIELTPAESSVSGTVESAGGEGEPIEGVLVECAVADQTVVAYTDDSGNYTLHLPEGDSGDGATGTWNYSTTKNWVIPGTAGCEAEEDDAGIATIIETGDDVTIVSDEGDTLTGTVSGSTYNLSGSFPDDGGTITDNITFTLSSSTSGSGTLTWSWTDGILSCNGGCDLYLTKQDGGIPAELVARASAVGYEAKRQDVADDPNFELVSLEGDVVIVGPDGGTLTAGVCTIDIQAGALDGTGEIQIDPEIQVETESVYTQNSVVLVDLNIVGANINEDTPIQVTIPFDTADVNPGDFKAGTAAIYYAGSADDLRNGTNVNSVSAEDIIYEDHLNGLVSFWVRHLSVFGVGVGAGGSAPTVSTGSATSITSTTATLTGTVNPNGTSTTCYFEYGQDTSYGSSTKHEDAGSGTSDVSVNAEITGLTDGTTYHFRLVATNSSGTTYGSDMTFTAEHHHGDGGGSCFIGTAASGSFLGYHTAIHMTFAHKMLVVALVLMLAAEGSMVLRRFSSK